VKIQYLILYLAVSGMMPMHAQTSDNSTQQVLESGKLIVELIQALGRKDGPPRDPGCKNRYADLCVDNGSAGSLTVYLACRATGEQRDIVILPGGQECSLQVQAGVWTYDLRPTGSAVSMRKGDIRIEGCQDLRMQIK